MNAARFTTTRPSVATAALHLALTLSGCSPSRAACGDAATTSSAIKFGTPDAGVDPVPARDDLFALHWLNLDEDEPVLACTATRVEGGGFVTARHCIPEELRDPNTGKAGSTTTLLLHPTALDEESIERCSRVHALVVERVTVHGSLDLAVLHAARAERGPSPGMTIAAAGPELDHEFYIAGFGLTEDVSLGALRALPARLESVGEAEISIQAEGGGACVGDSGGPLYRIDPDTRQATLHGVLRAGSATCLATDLYVDVSRAQPWLNAALRSR